MKAKKEAEKEIQKANKVKDEMKEKKMSVSEKKLTKPPPVAPSHLVADDSQEAQDILT